MRHRPHVIAPAHRQFAMESGEHAVELPLGQSADAGSAGVINTMTTSPAFKLGAVGRASGRCRISRHPAGVG